VIGLDLLVASVTWERPQLSLEKLLDSPHYNILSYCRGRDLPALRQDGKSYPPKTGGGVAIIYNKHRFQLADEEIGVPAGIEAVWCVLSPQRLDNKEQRVKQICVGSIYIAPRSPFKRESIDHVIHIIQLVRAKYNNNVHFLIGGDFNLVGVQDILDSYGGLQQMCSVPTRKGATLQLILTDLHTFMHPPSSHPPRQVDEGKKGVDSDHQALILAPKASTHFVKKREKRKVTIRPMPESKIFEFSAELTQHNWSEVLDTENPHQQVENFQKYLMELKDKHFPEKSVIISSLDKQWMTPELKLLLRQAQRERLRNGKK
jgi:hypothetical protein